MCSKSMMHDVRTTELRRLGWIPVLETLALEVYHVGNDGDLYDMITVICGANIARTPGALSTQL